jgi:hypothetical protein
MGFSITFEGKVPSSKTSDCLLAWLFAGSVFSIKDVCQLPSSAPLEFK